jgi:hypothetical protein
MVGATRFLPGLSLFRARRCRTLWWRLSSEGGLLVFRDIQRRLGLAHCRPRVSRSDGCRKRSFTAWQRSIRFRTLMIAAGYEDGNATLRWDSMFKRALDRLPSDKEFCPQFDDLAARKPS